jgi:prevent-host-death family protein
MRVMAMPSIISSSDLRNNYNDVSGFCNKNHEPVYITKNSNGDLAVMSIELFEKLTGRQELYAQLTLGRADMKAEKVRPAEDVFKDIEARINETVLNSDY